MAHNSDSPNGEQALSVQEATRGIEIALESRRAKSAPRSGCTSSMETSPLCVQIAKILQEKPSPRKPNDSTRGSFLIPGGRSGGLSPALSASSDNSLSAGGRGFSPPMEIERISLPIVGTPEADSARPIHGRGSSISARVTQPRVPVQAGGERMPNSLMPSSAPTSGRGKATVSASTSIAVGTAAPARAPGKKRKRLSKKPPTTQVEATKEGFKATVQRLTGCRVPPAPVICPQPVLPQPERPLEANAVPSAVDLDSANRPARPASSAASMMSAARSTVSDLVPEATLVTSVSSYSKLSLNYCMGFERNTPRFLEELEPDYDEDSGQRQDGDLQTALGSAYRDSSATTQCKKFEVSATPASPSGPSVEDAAPPPSTPFSGSNGKEGIRRESCVVGSNHYSGSDSPISHNFGRPPPVVLFHRRSEEQMSLAMEFELEYDDSIFNHVADSFIDYSRYYQT